MAMRGSYIGDVGMAASDVSNRACSPVKNTLSNAFDRLYRLQKMAEEANHSAESIIDRLEGSPGENGGVLREQSEAHSLIDRLHDRAERLENTLGQLLGKLSRLDAAVGHDMEKTARIG